MNKNVLEYKIDPKQNAQAQSNSSDAGASLEDDSNLEMTGFASETAESERETLKAYKEATASVTAPAPEIVIEPPGIQGHGDADNARVEEEQSKYSND